MIELLLYSKLCAEASGAGGLENVRHVMSIHDVVTETIHLAHAASQMVSSALLFLWGPPPPYFPESSTLTRNDFVTTFPPPIPLGDVITVYVAPGAQFPDSALTPKQKG